jgi:hypothetical protein
MKISKTLIFAIFTISLSLVVYFYEFRAEKLKNLSQGSGLLKFNIDQINSIQIIKPDFKMSFQRNDKGWKFLEPIFEAADADKINELLSVFQNQEVVATIKSTEVSFSDVILSEYGLDKPAVVYIFKNNKGESRRIAVGSVRNFEGQSYLYIDSGNKIILGSSSWADRAQDDLIYFRDKRIFREPMASVNKIFIQSLNEKIELKRIDGQWINPRLNIRIDQSQVRSILKKISDTQIENYIFEGEPSRKTLQEKGLHTASVVVQLFTDSTSWEAKINFNKATQKLYLLSDRPTFLAQVSPLIWEAVAGLTLDGLRDRTSAFSFNAEEVKKLYFKFNNQETNLIFSSGNWMMASNNSPYFEVDKTQITNTIKKIHSLRISEFLDNSAKDKFLGKNMLILKSESDKLVLQLNWGPAFSKKKDGKDVEYFYARTNQSENIFALEQKIIEDLNLNAEKIKRDNSGESVETFK